MKVLQIMAGDGNGGLENHFAELSNGLAKLDGVELTAIGHPKYADRFSTAVNYLSLDLSQSRKNPILLYKLLNTIKEQKPDIVHAQANKAASMLATVKSYVPGIKVATLHNQKSSLGMYSSMDAVIGVSSDVLTNVQHPQTRIIYNGMVPFTGEQLSREQLAQKFRLDINRPITIAVGRLVPTKAFDNLVNAWDSQFGQLVIFGEGPERETLEKAIRARSMEQDIRLAGFYRGIRGLMSSVDLMVFSSHREGYSYAMAEGLLARLPVLSTKVAGAIETLPEEHLIEINNVPALNLALKNCLADMATTRQRMEPVFDWAKQTLSIDNMVMETYRFYSELRSKPKSH